MQSECRNVLIHHAEEVPERIFGQTSLPVVSIPIIFVICRLKYAQTFGTTAILGRFQHHNELV